jgi:dipeptidase
MRLQALLLFLMVGVCLGAVPGELAGCTTILAGKNTTADGSVIMGHNEDMGDLSGRLVFQPAQAPEEKEIQLNYVTIPQIPETYAYWASGNSQAAADKHYDGGWVLCGMNQWGVSMGCNTVATREEPIPRGKGISRYSIRQLVLARAKTSRDAVEVVGMLIDTYGQSDSPVAYCFADRDEAWLVETTFHHWVARRIKDDEVHVETNEYTIETEYDKAGEGLVEYAVEQGWYKPEDGPFNFKFVYGEPTAMNEPRNVSRQYQGTYMLKNKFKLIGVKTVLAVLSEPPIQTTETQAFMIWHLRRSMPVEIGCVMWYGMSGANTSIAVPVYAGSSNIPVEYTSATYRYDSVSAWWQFERLQNLFYPRMWEYADEYPDLKKRLREFQEIIFNETEAVEKKALTGSDTSNPLGVDVLLSNHTYKSLQDALKEVAATASLSASADQTP